MFVGEDAKNFIQQNCRLQSPPLNPELKLWLAADDLPLWQMGEDALEKAGLEAPFWAFAWAGGQALARYLIDNPEEVRGKTVLDFGAGSAIAGIAAMQAGAAHVTASEIDPFCDPAIQLNAAENGVEITFSGDDYVNTTPPFDVILAADVCYEAAPARAIRHWLYGLAQQGTRVLIGDPGRTYFSAENMQRIAHYPVKTDSRVEDTDLRNAAVWEFVL